MEQPSITFLNYTGDVTITWEDGQREMIEKLVQAKIKEGYAFFIHKPILGGLINRKVKVNEGDSFGKAKSVTVPDKIAAQFLAAMNDPDLAQAVVTGKAVLSKPKPSQQAEIPMLSKDPKEIVHTVATAVKPVAGG